MPIWPWSRSWSAIFRFEEGIVHDHFLTLNAKLRIDSRNAKSQKCITKLAIERSTLLSNNYHTLHRSPPPPRCKPPLWLHNLVAHPLHNLQTSSIQGRNDFIVRSTVFHKPSTSQYSSQTPPLHQPSEITPNRTGGEQLYSPDLYHSTYHCPQQLDSPKLIRMPR